MFIDALDRSLATDRTRASWLAIAARRVTSLALAARRYPPVDDLSDRDLAELHLRRDDVTRIDPREMPLF